jgi:K+-transporting ATPase ATPase C chain
MVRRILVSLLMVVLLTVFVGGVYPLVITGISDLAFSHKANGSLIY